MKSQKKRKWTIFFIVKSVGASINETIRMINEIRQHETGAQISIVLCLNFVREHLQAILEGDENFEPKEGEVGTPTTMFFELVPDPGPAAFATRLTVLSEVQTFDITDPDDVEKYLRNTVLRSHKAKRYLLLTWDHGRGYGIFPGDDENQKIVVKQEASKILTMEELSQAIRWAFGRRKVDVAIMMNCFMQFVDAGYALRKSVGYLVAPQNSMDFKGYNYDAIFQALLNEPGISPRRLAKIAVRSFRTKVYSDRGNGRVTKSMSAVVATNLRHYDSLAEQIDRLVDVVLPLLDQESTRETFTKLVNESYMDPGRYLVDFFGLMRRLDRSQLLDEHARIDRLLLSAGELVIVQRFIGTAVMQFATGMTVFLPRELSSSTQEKFKEFFCTEFMTKRKWRKLIDKYAG